jgi:hypothetical protein
MDSDEKSFGKVIGKHLGSMQLKEILDGIGQEDPAAVETWVKQNFTVEHPADVELNDLEITWA